jgi:homoserine O-acetyltransferase/O-succinyltransferase
MPEMDYEIFELGDVTLQSGMTIRNAQLAYNTYGTLNVEKSNAIVYPTWYSGQHYDNEWLIGAGMALDLQKYFILIPNMFGNGPIFVPQQHASTYGQGTLPQCHHLR